MVNFFTLAGLIATQGLLHMANNRMKEITVEFDQIAEQSKKLMDSDGKLMMICENLREQNHELKANCSSLRINADKLVSSSQKLRDANMQLRSLVTRLAVSCNEPQKPVF